MVELFSTTAVAMAGLSMGLIVGSALADRTSAEKTPLSQGGVGAASNNGLFPVNTAAVCRGLPTTKLINSFGVCILTPYSATVTAFDTS